MLTSYVVKRKSMGAESALGTMRKKQQCHRRASLAKNKQRRRSGKKVVSESLAKRPQRCQHRARMMEHVGVVKAAVWERRGRSGCVRCLEFRCLLNPKPRWFWKASQPPYIDVPDKWLNGSRGDWDQMKSLLNVIYQSEKPVSFAPRSPDSGCREGQIGSVCEVW